MEKLHLPKQWYIARIDFLESKINKSERIILGKHNGKDVIRIVSDGHKKEIGSLSPEFTRYYQIAQEQTALRLELKRLKKEWNQYFKEGLGAARLRFVVKPNISSPMTYDSWKSLTDNECPDEKKTDYIVGSYNLRSRFEMQLAQASDDLGLKFKYDCGIRLDSGYMNFLDFAFGFEEFNRWVSFELFGMLDNPGYIAKTATKIKNYIENKMYIGRDFFIQSGDGRYMENMQMTKHLLISMVEKLCDMYVLEITPNSDLRE